MYEDDGQRGILMADVLGEFIRMQFDPFDLYLSTSVGAQNLSAFICNRPGYTCKVTMHYTTKHGLLDPLRLAHGGDLIGLDWPVETTTSQMLLQMDIAARLSDSGKSFHIRACRQGDHMSNHFLSIKQNWSGVIRASNAIPGSYRSGVSLKGINYLDGGISDAIPIKEAARQGARTLVVTCTVPSQMYYMPQRFKCMECWLGDSSLQPLADLMQHHETSHCNIQQSIEKPPGKLQTLEIYPPESLHSAALGSRISALCEDYRLGRLCDRYSPTMVGKSLTEKAPPTRHLVPAVTLESVATPSASVASNTLVAEASDAPQADDPTFNNEDLV